MSTGPKLWPAPAELLGGFGEGNLSRDEDGVVAVSAEAVLNAYTRWYESQREASGKIAEQECRLLKAEEETAAWKTRCDQLLAISMNAGGQGQNLIVQKIKPHEPKRFDGSQDLEVVSQFLEDVQHYVRQGGAVCQKASEDNQKIDTLWRFLTTKVFHWFEDSMKKQGLDTIPPADYDYRITWDAVKILFKRQFVPERAISVIRREWYTLKFNRLQVLSFNQRALELVTILGGSLTITRENPLWEEYLLKLPEATQNDISQQARLMDILGNSKMTLSQMMDIVAARTLPFLPTSSNPTAQALASSTMLHHDPMDLTNIESDELNLVVDEKIQCHRCQGFGHMARQCGTPDTSNRAAQFRTRGGREGGRQTMRYESSRRQPPQPPTRQNVTQPFRGRQPPQRIIQSSWRNPPRRVNNIDDPETRADAYLDGDWAEEGVMEDTGEETGLLEPGGAEWEKADKQELSKGKGSQ